MARSSKKAKKMYLHMVQSVQIFGRPPKAMKVDNLAISFTEEDVDDYTTLMTMLWSLSCPSWTLIPDGY